MKRYIYAIVVAVLLVGCGEKSEERDVDMKEGDASKIEVTQGEKRVENADTKPREEVKKDNKGFYYAYDEDDKKKESQAETFTVVDAQKKVKNAGIVDGMVTVLNNNQDASSPYEYVKIDLLKNSLSKNFLVKCSACHDDYANGIIGPSLLEKDGNFIYGKMIKYRNDKAKNVLMYDLMKNMPEDELKALSDEIALFNKEVRALKGMK
jgi:cytochrome c553